MEELEDTKVKQGNTAKGSDEEQDFFIAQTDEASQILDEKLSMTQERKKHRKGSETSNTFFLSDSHLDDLQE